jgi:translocator protein
MDNWRFWYDSLAKPTWTPESSTIGLIWNILYPIIFVSFGIVFYKVFKKEIKLNVTIPFILNLLFNFAFTPILFGLKNLPLASIDILLVLITILWSMKAIYPHAKYITFLQIPYLIWVSIATTLQLSILVMNQ